MERLKMVSCAESKVIFLPALFCCFISVACLGAIIHLTHEFSYSSTVRKNTSQVCLNCQKLKNFQEDAWKPLLFQLKKRKESSRSYEECCAENADQLALLLQLASQKTSKSQESLHQMAPHNFTLSIASAHKPLKARNFYMGSSVHVPEHHNHMFFQLILENEIDNAITDHANNVELLQNGYRIVYSGMYYVYASLHFKPHSDRPCREFYSTTFEYIIEKSRQNDPIGSAVLLRSVHKCADKIVQDSETSYTGGVFHLQAGDLLTMDVSGRGITSFHQSSTYIGLVMLGHVKN